MRQTGSCNFQRLFFFVRHTQVKPWHDPINASEAARALGNECVGSAIRPSERHRMGAVGGVQIGEGFGAEGQVLARRDVLKLC